MTPAFPQTLTLEEFLKLPNLEESPAWEYIRGRALQKPMSKTRHSILQKPLIAAIDNHSDTYTALPELRCTFSGRSIVPDIAVVAWNRIPLKETGEPEDDFLAAPDWSIEILSPDQKANRVIDNLLHCLQNGCELGWLIDPDDYSILIFAPQQEPKVSRGDQLLHVLPGIDLALNASQVFAWLQLGKR
jgi:Uma2 family endonuclease